MQAPISSRSTIPVGPPPVAGVAVSVPLVIRDDAGAQIGTGTIPLAANGHNARRPWANVADWSSLPRPADKSPFWESALLPRKHLRRCRRLPGKKTSGAEAA